MHLLAAEAGVVADGTSAVDLGQSPAEIVILTAASSEIACLAAAQHQVQGEDENASALRLANLLRLGHNLSVDLHAEFSDLIGVQFAYFPK